MVLKIIGISICVISLFVLYKRFALLIFGKSAQGYIVGYGNSTRGMRGVEAYPYKVKYEYQNQEYIAQSLESVSISKGDVPNKNMNKQVIVYFKTNKPEVVTIKEFKGTTIIGILFLILGVLTMIV